MHCNGGRIPDSYRQYLLSKRLFMGGCLFLLVATFIFAIALGPTTLPINEVIRSLLDRDLISRTDIIIWNIRLPQILTAIVAGAGLSVAGAVMQAILRNPLGSPFTLGISHAAAFGAAFSVMILEKNSMFVNSVNASDLTSPYLVTSGAFLFSVIAAMIIVAVARFRGATPETMILTGVALGAFFTAGTMFLQFFADDVQLAAMVFWTFGDTARASWPELRLMTAIVFLCILYFFSNAWGYNAIESGDETALGLGVRVHRIRLLGMLLSSLLTAVLIGFLGIIGFVGLVVPHMLRRLIGSDHCYLLPASMLGGAFLLLLSDTAARMLLAPALLPVSVLTAFLGAPVFLFLIIRGAGK